MANKQKTRTFGIVPCHGWHNRHNQKTRTFGIVPCHGWHNRHNYLIRAMIYFIFILQSFCHTSGIKKEIASDLKRLETVKINLTNEEALFLAGKDNELKDTDLKKLSASPSYQNYKKSIQNYWQYYQEIAAPLHIWQTANLPSLIAKTVLYSFSGPDFPNAFNLFPDADTYILMGLEASGFDPNLKKMSPIELNQGLFTLSSGLISISKYNFFQTIHMAKDISQSKIKGTVPVFLTYFGLIGLEPIVIKHFIFNNDGSFHYLPEDEINHLPKYKNGFMNVEIFFRTKNGDLKKLIFLSGDISNSGIAIDGGAFNYLQKLPTSLVTMKAASYLVHNGTYSKIRNLLLEKAELFIMDDTGPKITDFKENWNIKVFGKYTRPIPLFSNRYQKELFELHQLQKPEKINFKFGYGCADGNQHIMLVTRKALAP